MSTFKGGCLAPRDGDFVIEVAAPGVSEAIRQKITLSAGEKIPDEVQIDKDRKGKVVSVELHQLRPGEVVPRDGCYHNNVSGKTADLKGGEKFPPGPMIYWFRDYLNGGDVATEGSHKYLRTSDQTGSPTAVEAGSKLPGPVTETYAIDPTPSNGVAADEGAYFNSLTMRPIKMKKGDRFPEASDYTLVKESDKAA